MNSLDPRTEASIPAGTVGQAGTAAADVAMAAAADSRMSPATLRKMLLSIGCGIADEDDLLNLLQRVVEIAHEAIDGADSTGVTIDLGGRTYTAVHTDERTLRVDTEQYNAGEGPCLHASRTNSLVVVDADAAVQRWPQFAEAARAQGIRSFLAAPLLTSEHSLGSFNLYGRSPAAFDAVDAEILELFTTTVARAIGDFARFKSARDVAESLQRALETRAPIEQAKGMLMAIHGINADDAFAMLRKQSQDTNVRLRIVAAELVEKLSTDR